MSQAKRHRPWSQAGNLQIVVDRGARLRFLVGKFPSSSVCVGSIFVSIAAKPDSLEVVYVPMLKSRNLIRLDVSKRGCSTRLASTKGGRTAGSPTIPLDGRWIPAPRSIGPCAHRSRKDFHRAPQSASKRVVDGAVRHNAKLSKRIIGAFVWDKESISPK
jgi:hypothetical protein